MGTIERSRFGQFELVASRGAVGRQAVGLRPAERGQRELLLMTGDAILVAGVPAERSGRSPGRPGQRGQRALEGV